MWVWCWVRPQECSSLRAWAFDSWHTYTENPNRSIAMHGYERGRRLFGLEIVEMSICSGYLP